MRNAADLLEGRKSELRLPALMELLNLAGFSLLTVPSGDGLRDKLAAQVEVASAELRRLDQQALRVRETVATHVEELEALLEAHLRSR